MTSRLHSWLSPLLRFAPSGRRGAPLGDDPASRFLGVITVLMSFLAALALAGALAVSDMADRWSDGLAGGLTVQVAAASPGGMPLAPLAERVEAALIILRATPGVRGADPLSAAALSQLLEPWLGPGAAADPLLPVPALIDVAVDGPVDLAGLRARLDAAGLAAAVDDHGVWLADFSAFAAAVEAAALGVVALIVCAGLLAVAFAVRTGLAIHEDVVRLLHLMGATDGYIARQFEVHVGWRVLRGGAVGGGAAALTLLALDHAAGDLRASLLPSLSFAAWQWALLLAAPPSMALPAVATARWAVLRSLERMP